MARVRRTCSTVLPSALRCGFLMRPKCLAQAVTSTPADSLWLSEVPENLFKIYCSANAQSLYCLFHCQR